MSLVVNGTTIPTNKPFKVNGIDVYEVNANGTEVWFVNTMNYRKDHEYVWVGTTSTVWFQGKQIGRENSTTTDTFNVGGKTYKKGAFVTGGVNGTKYYKIQRVS